MSRGSAPSLRAAASNARAARNRRNGRGHPVGDRELGLRAGRIGDDRDDQRSRRVERRRVSRRARRPPLPSDPSPRTATEAIAAMPPIDVPNSATRRMPRSPSQAECAGDVLDLEHPERRRSGVRLAMPAEVDAEDARRPAQERRVLDEVRGDRARVAVEQQDRLVRIGYPVRRRRRRPGSQRPASRSPSRERKRTTSPPSASSCVRRAPPRSGATRGASSRRSAARLPTTRSPTTETAAAADGRRRRD